MAMKGYSAFFKASALMVPHHQIVECNTQDTHCGGESYTSEAMQSVYFTTPANRVDGYIAVEMQKIIANFLFFIFTIGPVGRVFANGPGDRGSIPGRVIPKTLKMVLDTSLLNTQQYKVRIESKVEQSRERISALPTPRCSSYCKGSLVVALDYGRQLYLLYFWLIQTVKTKRTSKTQCRETPFYMHWPNPSARGGWDTR